MTSGGSAPRTGEVDLQHEVPLMAGSGSTASPSVHRLITCPSRSPPTSLG